MTHGTNLTLFASSSLALTLLVGGWATLQAQTQKPVEASSAADEPMLAQCETLKEQRTKMMSDMKADDGALTAQVAKMNSAPADKKLDLLAAVVTRGVEQRVAMTPRMEKMSADMLMHVLQHMQRGKDSMLQCPMMNEMGGKSAGTHAEHRETKN